MSGSLPAIRPKNYKEKPYFRKLKSQVDGSAKVEHALTQIRGVGRRFAQAVVMVAEIDPNMRIGAVSEKDLNRIEEIILNPVENGIPNWMVNRKNDLREGTDKHLIGNQLEITVKRDVARMKKIRSYKGVRHHFHLKVRGQRTKSTGRHGLVVGVIRRKKGQK
ncbi:MAG: 30S ribosomal protein S13 [Promethearchaeota archaeon]